MVRGILRDSLPIAYTNGVLTGRLCGRQKWEPSLVRGGHDELLCCKPSLLGVIGALASKY